MIIHGTSEVKYLEYEIRVYFCGAANGLFGTAHLRALPGHPPCEWVARPHTYIQYSVRSAILAGHRIFILLLNNAFAMKPCHSMPSSTHIAILSYFAEYGEHCIGIYNGLIVSIETLKGVPIRYLASFLLCFVSGHCPHTSDSRYFPEIGDRRGAYNWLL